jgi:signal transduction histidine kinase
VLARRAGEVYVPDGSYLLFIVMLTLLCTGITAVVYRQRHANYELRQIQARVLLAENATSLARLAAALSHELNNPMGALLSGIDTLLLLTTRQATCATAQEQTRLVILQADLRKSIQQSAARLKKLVARMQRFTNLDQAEVQSVDLNELLTDVAALLEPQLPPATKLALDLRPLEAVVCRPQQISAVFSNLLTNAAQAVNGEGGRIVVSTRQKAREIEIEFRDNGHGVDKKHLDDIFEPSLEAKGSRVRSGNWSMFTSRQIIREHGGEIRIDSGQGKGTTVWVTLPLNAEALT